MYAPDPIDEQVKFYEKFDELKRGATDLHKYKLNVGEFNEFFEENVMSAWKKAERLSSPGNNYMQIKNLLTPQTDKLDPRVVVMPKFEDIEKARQLMKNYAESQDFMFNSITEDDIVLYQSINNCLDILKYTKLYNQLAKEHINGLDRSE